MAITRPGGPGRKSSSKNPPILSHEFVIQNHADIVSCFALVFVVGLMVQATSSIASIFIALHHSVAGSEPTAENPRGETFLYESGWKDQCAILFYTLICIIMHAILQEYLLDKVSKKFQTQSKAKANRLNESGQLVVFSLISALWGLDVMLRDGLFSLSSAWKGYPDHPMSFLMKLYFIIQLAYYLHMLPELYFQRVKKEDQGPKIYRSLIGMAMIGACYYWQFHRLGLVLLTLHYFCETIQHTFLLVEIFDKNDKLSKFAWFYDIFFVVTRLTIMVLSVLGLFYGINTTPSMIMLFFTYAFQGYSFVNFIKEFFRKRKEQKDSKQQKKKNAPKSEKKKKAPAVESDLPEADQNRKLKGQ